MPTGEIMPYADIGTGTWVEVWKEPSGFNNSRYRTVDSRIRQDSFYLDKSEVFDTIPNTPAPSSLPVVGERIKVEYEKTMVLRAERTGYSCSPYTEVRFDKDDFEDLYSDVTSVEVQWAVTAVSGWDPKFTHYCGYCEKYATDNTNGRCGECKKSDWKPWDRGGKTFTVGQVITGTFRKGTDF